MIILDTDLLSLIQLRQGPEYLRLAQRLVDSGQPVAVTIISLEEQLRGWLAYIARSRMARDQVRPYARLHALLEDFGTRPVLEFGYRAAEVLADLQRQHLRVGTMDLKIAAIALSERAMLLSRNLPDFRKIPGLDVEDWTR